MLKCILKSMKMELEAAECYYKKGTCYRGEYINVASVYFDVAAQELEHFNKFNNLGNNLISRMKNDNSENFDECKIIWDYEHNELIQRYDELKYKISKLNA